MLKRLLIRFAMIWLFVPIFQASGSESPNAANSAFEGVWFSCEFAQRQRAPDDDCAMFDDEGFYYTQGKLYYLRMKGSQQTACRGNKKGQCFQRNKAAITATQKPIAKLRIEGDRLIARYWGCDQSYVMTTGEAFMTIKPLGKNCLWSQERHFYIAPYHGKLTIVEP